MAGSRARGVDAAKAPEAIRSIVTTYLARHRYDAVPSWPLMFAVRWPDQRTLTTQAPDWHRANNALREWARRCGCATTEKNRLMVTPVALIDTVGVTDEATALRVVGEQAARRYRKARERIDRLVGELDVSRETASVVANMLDRESDTDFTLAIQAARFFATHDVSGMTPRQVPLAGFSAKWLDQTHAKRRGAICTLCGKDSLGLSERPVELRMRWLDPADADKPEMMVTTPWQPGGERDICYVIIVENKDTYLGMPAIRDGLCVWGAGRAIEASISLLPWLGTSGERGCETHVVYWGDVDADGCYSAQVLRGGAWKSSMPCGKPGYAAGRCSWMRKLTGATRGSGRISSRKALLSLRANPKRHPCSTPVNANCTRWSAAPTLPAAPTIFVSNRSASRLPMPSTRYAH